MTSRDSDHASADDLHRLIAMVPEPNWSEGVRVRCRTQLERSGRRAARTAAIAGFASRVMAPVVVGAFCVLYVALLVATTLRLEGLVQ
jgi:hypothetical protein